MIYLVLHTNFGCLRFAVGTSGFRSDKLPPRFEPPSISKSILYPSPPPGRSKLCLFLVIFIHGRPTVFDNGNHIEYNYYYDRKMERNFGRNIEIIP